MSSKPGGRTPPAPARRFRVAKRTVLGGEVLEDRRLLTASWPVRAGAVDDPALFDDIEAALDVTTLPDGSAIMTGMFKGTATFGTQTLTSAGGTDVFVAKIKADGSFAWATRAGGANADAGISISRIPATSAVILTGYFRGSGTFGGTTLTHAAGAASAEVGVFVARVAADGTFAWATRSGGYGGAVGQDVAAAADGSAVVVGSFADGVSFGKLSLQSSGGIDAFVAKIGPTGQFAWASRGGGSGKDVAYGVTLLGAGAVAVVGNFSATAGFGSTTLTSAGQQDAFVTRVSASGQFAWAVRGGGAGEDGCFGVATVAGGALVVTGACEGTAGFGGESLAGTGRRLFVTRLSSDGKFSWARSAAGGSQGNGVAPLADGSGVVVSGWFSGTVAFGGSTVTSGGADYGAVAVKVLADGTFAWASAATGTNTVQASRIAAAADGSCIMVGSFADSATFGSTTILSAGWFDIFAARVTAAGSFDLPPGPPSQPTGQGRVASAELTWTAPVANGGPPVTNYVVQYRPANQRVPQWTTKFSIMPNPATQATVATLANGQPYLFRVAAVNAGGQGPFSPPSLAIKPRGLPGAPAGLTATAGDSQVTLSWQAPASDGGAAISGYLVEYSSDLATWTAVPGTLMPPGVAPPTTVTVKGLVNGVGYSLRVAARNIAGVGAYASTDTLAVFPKGLPAAPTGVSAVAGKGKATVSWIAPQSNGGALVSSYRISYARKVGSTWAAWKHVEQSAFQPPTAVVSGLAGGSLYRFRVAAVNAVGVGASSPQAAFATPT